MALPKRKLHRKYTRRANINLSWPSFRKDPKTGKWILSHHVSPYTGEYNDKKIISVDN